MTVTFPENDTVEQIKEDCKRHEAELYEEYGVANWMDPKLPLLEYLDRVSAPHNERMHRLNEIRDGKISGAPKRQARSGIEEWLATKIGHIVNAAAIAEGSGCSMSSAYSYLSDNRSEFRSTDRRGYYIVLDGDAERRRAAKTPAAAPVLPSPVSKPARGATAAADDANDVLDALTGSGRHAGGGAPA